MEVVKEVKIWAVTCRAVKRNAEILECMGIASMRLHMYRRQWHSKQSKPFSIKYIIISLGENKAPTAPHICRCVMRVWLTEVCGGACDDGDVSAIIWGFNLLCRISVSSHVVIPMSEIRTGKRWRHSHCRYRYCYEESKDSLLFVGWFGKYCLVLQF